MQMPTMQEFTRQIEAQPCIPNYYLPKVQKEHPPFEQVQPLTFWRSLKSLNYRLWDEQRKIMVGFNVLRNHRRQQGT